MNTVFKTWMLAIVFLLAMARAKPAQAHQQKCKWTATDRYLESSAKQEVDSKRTKEYCQRNYTNNISIKDFILCRRNGNFIYVRKECSCTKTHGCKESMQNCETDCKNVEGLCLNNGTLNEEQCTDNNIKCDCPDETFQGDFCENILEQRQCIVTSAPLESNTEPPHRCGEGKIKDTDCYLHLGESWFSCSQPEKDLKGLQTVQSLPECTNDSATDEIVTDPPCDSEWSTWSACKSIGMNESLCVCRARICDINTKEIQTEVNCTVHGNWTLWSPWSSCSATCGKHGNRMRSRQCSNPSPLNGGMECEGSDIEYMKCADNPKCPRYYTRSPWSNWTRMDMNATHYHNVKSRYMCRSGIREELRALACYAKTRVKLCDKHSNKCSKINVHSMTQLKFPLDWMIGKYCTIHRKFLGKFCSCQQKDGKFVCESCKRSPLDNKYCFCVGGSCTNENIYINSDALND